MWMLYLYDKPHFLGSFLPRMVIGINIRLKSYWMKNPLRKEGNQKRLNSCSYGKHK